MVCLLSLLFILNLELSEKIPFKFYENKIVVDIEIEDVKKTFFIDTGAPSFIRKSKTADTTKIYHDLKLGSLKIDSFKFLVNAYDFDSDKFENIYGVLGYDFLSRFNFYIDWDAEILIFKKRGNLQPFNKAAQAVHTLPFQFQDSPPSLTLKINDFNVQPGINFDTGSGQGVLLQNVYYTLYSKKVDSSKLDKTVFDFIDVKGRHSGLYNTIQFDSLKVGDLKLENETILFNETHNIIGLHPFLNYNIEINWDSKTIALFEREK